MIHSFNSNVKSEKNQMIQSKSRNQFMAVKTIQKLWKMYE